MKSLSHIMKPFVLSLAALSIIVSDGAAQDPVAFIVSGIDPTSMEPTDPSDLYIYNILVNEREYDVTLVSQDADGPTTLAAAEASELTIVSESVGSGAVGVEIKDTTKPVLYYEPWLYDDLAWVDGTTANDFMETTDAGNAPGIEMLTIAAPEHPLAAGLSGDVSIYSNPANPTAPAVGSVSYGRFGPSFPMHSNPTVIATIPGNPEAPAIFVHEQGDTDLNGTSIAGLRIGFFSSGIVFNDLEFSDDGLALFNAALDYATGPGNVPGDVDLDRDVDLEDYAIIRDNFHQSVTERTEGDLNRDGVVDFLDFRSWKLRNPTPFVPEGLAAVPEPSCAALLVLATLIGCAPSRRTVSEGTTND